MSRRKHCDALQWIAAGLVVFLLVSTQDRDLGNDGDWSYGRGGIDRDVYNDGTLDFDKGGIDLDLDNDGAWDE